LIFSLGGGEIVESCLSIFTMEVVSRLSDFIAFFLLGLLAQELINKTMKNKKIKK
jgi:hypothetical protein